MPSMKEPVTAEWLTHVLREAGELPQGVVQSVVSRANSAFNAVVTHLELMFTADAPASAPRALVLKRSLPVEWARHCGAKEVGFYRLVASLSDHPRMTVRCYGAEVDAQTGDSWLLLEDVSATHHPPQTRDQQIAQGGNLPSAGDISLTVAALAQFHAYWWEHPRLGEEVTPVAHWFQDAAHFAAYTERRTRAWEALRTAESDWLPEDVTRFYDTLIARMPFLWTRYWQPRFASRAHVTLTHGDAYFANFLCPNAGVPAPTYLIDWQSPETFLAASDLVTLIATFWTRTQRTEESREERMLRQYHQVLLAHGVTGYSWESLLADYRLALLDWALVPLQDRLDGSAADYWWPKMQCLLAACRDHHAETLLTGG